MIVSVVQVAMLKNKDYVPFEEVVVLLYVQN